MSFKILVVDDKILAKDDIISGLPAQLQAAGYEVATEADGDAAYDRVFDYQPDLIVLDIHLNHPDINGIDICQAIRDNGYRTPIILITANFTETEDVLAGFNAGADDYVIRPCDNREILARIRANLPPGVVDIDDRIRIDFDERRVWAKTQDAWQEVCLQPLLFRLLQTLVINAGRMMEATRLKDRVWEKDISDDALAVFIRRLREKLEPDPHHPTYIETIRGVGYRFNGRPARTRHGTSQRRSLCC
jgi:DNA-binding response OmpR family regulator